MQNPSIASRREFLKCSALSAAACLLPEIADAAPARSGLGSSKKGLCMVAKSDGVWLDRAKKANAAWFYSWGSNKPANTPANLNFVPMIWGYWGNKSSILKAGAAAKTAGCKELLGFNEPDEKKQANMSVEKALEAWPTLMETGLRLGSPGCVHPDGPWMQRFMEEVRKRRLQVDFVCVHSYGGTDANAFMDRLERVAKQFRKPLWITEFACGDWQAKSPQQNRHKPEQVLKFMESVIPRLEKARFIERYAWYPAPTTSNPLGTSALFQPDGSLTRLGSLYASF
jgi:hypothetical protein